MVVEQSRGIQVGGGRVAADAELKIEYAASPTPADHFPK
jgi:hypothetical protein